MYLRVSMHASIWRAGAPVAGCGRSLCSIHRQNICFLLWLRCSSSSRLSPCRLLTCSSDKCPLSPYNTCHSCGRDKLRLLIHTLMPLMASTEDLLVNSSLSHPMTVSEVNNTLDSNIHSNNSTRLDRAIQFASAYMGQRIKWFRLYIDFHSVTSFLASTAMIFGGIIPYIPQYIEIHRTQNSSGFSTYVCLNLIAANVLRIIFW